MWSQRICYLFLPDQARINIRELLMTSRFTKTHLICRPFYAQTTPVKSHAICGNTIERGLGILCDGKRHVSNTFRHPRSVFENYESRAHWSNVREKGVQVGR